MKYPTTHDDPTSVFPGENEDVADASWRRMRANHSAMLVEDAAERRQRRRRKDSHRPAAIRQSIAAARPQRQARRESSGACPVPTRGSRRSYSRGGDSGDDGDGSDDGSSSVVAALEREADRPLNPRRLVLRRLAHHLRSRGAGRQLTLDREGAR